MGPLNYMKLILNYPTLCKLTLHQALSHLAGVDANMDCGSIGLLSLDTLNVDDVLLPVDLHHFANLLAFVVSADNLFVNKQPLRSAP